MVQMTTEKMKNRHFIADFAIFVAGIAF